MAIGEGDFFKMGFVTFKFRGRILFNWSGPRGGWLHRGAVARLLAIQHSFCLGRCSDGLSVVLPFLRL
jgi:hypothetical protein